MPAEDADEGKRMLAVLITGAALFTIGEVMERVFPAAAQYAFIVYIIAYLVLGGGILLKAGKNLIRGQIFDENLLMSVATIGAVIIGQYAEAVGVMLFFRIGEYFEHRAVEKSRSQIMSAVDMRPEVVSLVTDDDISVIPAENAKPGDILLVRPGDRIPLDGVVVDGESRIDTSPVTGEPVPIRAVPGDEVLSGCVNTSGLLKIKALKPLSESMVTRILDSVENAAASKPKIDRFISRFARIYTPCVLALAALVAVIPSLITGEWSYWVYTALTFLVISCPCALVLSVPLAFFAGIGAGSRKGILFKGGVTLEALKKVKAVVMDKTGTITKGSFEVLEIAPSIESKMDGDSLLALAAGCESASSHPIAAGILTAAKKKGLHIEKPTSVREIAGQGITASYGENEVLCGNDILLRENGVNTPMLPQNGGTTVLLAVNSVFAGYIIIDDAIKDEAKSAVAKIKRGGIKTTMLTGDAVDRAEIVAKTIGLDEAYARLLPEDKVSRLDAVRAKNGVVMYVGDGINDAPVLAAADVGAAMGSGADAAIEVADVVFMTSSLEAIPESISIARSSCRIAMQNVVFALVIKAVIMALGLLGFASMWTAVFADTGVSLLCVLNSIRILYRK